MSSAIPAAADPEVDGHGREMHDPAQAATALLEGEPLVILRSESADAQAGKVDALRAALQRQSVRVLRLNGTHPRGPSPLAVAERDADRAVLVVEHAEQLEPSTLEALRDVENLQLVLVDREDAPIDLRALEPASVRFPPGLVAFDLDPERRRWRPLVGAALLTLTVAGLLAAAMLYIDPPWKSADGERTTTAMVISRLPASTTPSIAPDASSGGESAAHLEQSPAGNESGSAPQSTTTPTEVSAPPPTSGEAGAAPSAAPATAEQSSPNSVAASDDQGGPSEPTAAQSPTGPAMASRSQATPAKAASSKSADAGPASSAEASRSAPGPAAARPSPFHSQQRAQLKHDFDRFLAVDHHLPKHLTRAQRSALFEKFLTWRGREELNAAR